MYIGDIYLPILSSIDKKSVSKITKEIAGINITEPKSVSIRRNLQPVTLDGYLYNDGEKNDEQYAEDVEALQYRSAGYCYIKYADLDGFIEIDNADAPQTSEELGVRNYSVEGKYLPATKYERVVEVETEMRDNEFDIEFPPHVALPDGATNVRVKTSQDSVKLSAPAFTVGNIPIYRPFPAFYPADVTHSDSDAPQYDATAYKLSYNLLDAKDESISYTMVSGVDVPLGSYRVVLRIKEDSTVNGDVKITVSDGTNNVVDSLHTLVGDGVWNIVKTASFNILQRGLTYTITVSKATDSVSNIAVNYGFLLPEKRARVAFDVAAEYDVGECKVYDTITTDAAEAGWIQVYNPEHDFAGDIVVQNSMFRWVIKQTAWKDATKVYNVTGTSPVEIGELYNKAFGDDSVAIKFKEIKPNYLKFTFELDTGNATSESTSAKEIDTVEITPFNVVIDKDVIGTYKDHYTFESTPGAMVEYENGIIAGIDSNSVYGLIKSIDVTSSIDGDIIETTGSESSDSYVVPFVIPCEITSYLYKQAADLVISKDNGDIERKFWKDDFSVDSSDQWTLADGDLTIDTANQKMVINDIPRDYLYHNLSLSQELTHIGAVEFVYNIDPNDIATEGYGRIGITIGDQQVGRLERKPTDPTVNMIYLFNDDGYGYVTGTIPNADDIRAKFVIEGRTITGYLNGVQKVTCTLKSAVDLSDPFGFVVSMTSDAGAVGLFEIKDLSVSPPKSYADSFTSDTVTGANGRYQAVTGTVAYDDVNKRMNIITATGANGNAFGRLKSYKFTEGSQIYDVALPTGADGDFITLVTHSANGLMTDGIGVGLQSDGAGNWNLATLSGTTVTEGADSGLDDADVARIEIEKDLSGAYWYYIYNASGVKPTTATGKLFTTLTEGYTGWYCNGAGAETQTYAIDNISIRAESIVGRTNVEVEEPFWFRDEFGENSIGRCKGNTTSFAISAGALYQVGADSQITIPGYVSQPTIVSDFKVNLGGSGEARVIYSWGLPVDTYTGYLFSTDPSTIGTRYYIYFRQDAATKTVQMTKYVNKIAVNTDLTWNTTDPLDLVADTMYRLTITWINETTFTIVVIKVSDESVAFTKTVTDTNASGTGILDTGYINIATSSKTDWVIDSIQISGTRVYNKPIHRGAMLETYHDGTQEVVGTTFVDDCNWDRSAEYTVTSGATVTRDTTNGWIDSTSPMYTVTSKAGQFGDGIYQIKVDALGASSTCYPNPLYFCAASIPSDSCYASLLSGYFIQTNSTSIGLYTNDSAGNRTTLGTYTIATNVGRNEYYTIVKIGSSIKLYISQTPDFLSGTLIVDVTHAGYSSGYCGFGCGGNVGVYELRYSDFKIIAASPDATNGIAACIPPIGGGARYEVEESVYNTFTTVNVDKGSYLAAVNIKTTNIAADEASLEFINETDSTTLSLERTETEKPLTLNADYTVLTESLNIDDEETDVLTVGVKNSTTCNQPATYVESLSLIPVSGNSVLYPQDLAFISGVKSSQKRKVEVK